MATRILGPTGSKRRKRALLGPILLAAALVALFVAGAAKAVHDEAFQLDGDVSASTVTNVCGPGETPPCHTQSFDWDSFFNSSGSPIYPTLPDPLVPGFTASGFDRDFVTTNNDTKYDTSDATTYTQGSKDINNISSNWVCAAANNVTDKGDIQNAYAVAYTDPNTGDQKLYFGLERNSNNGDANVAFWFLQSEANCSTANGTSAWSGDHQDGDILIVSAFTKGGNVSTITAYRWTGGAGGSLDPTPVASGADCRSSSVPPGDPICAAANTVPLTGATGTPWLTDNNGKTTGLDHSLLTGEFFEGGINLTKTNLAGRCFNTFVGDTRSSQSLTATLYDYARGSLGECKTTLTTKAGDTANGGVASPTSIGTGTVASGTDTATLTITGTNTWTGSLKFYICGPIASGRCDANGVLVTSRTVSDSSPATDFVSGQANLTSAGNNGRYCWFSSFTPDAASAAKGVKGASDGGPATGTNPECFTISPKVPTLSTTASCSATPCVLGSTLSDTAMLSGTATEPGTNGGKGIDNVQTSYVTINATSPAAADNSISWTLYGPASDGSAACTTVKLGPTTRAVSGDGTYPKTGPPDNQPAVSYTTSAATDGLGTYTFVASYPGDSPNTSAASPVTCPDPANGTEHIVVTSVATTTTAQKWLPQDTATVTASGSATVAGTVTFQLFESTDCSGTAVQTFGPITVVNGQATTNNTTYYTTNKQVSWRATFTSSNNVGSGSPSHCERSDIANLNNDLGPGS